MHAIIASAALLVTAVTASSVGTARVINACNYNVFLAAVPAANGGYSETSKWLQPNDKFEQTFTELTNQMGWSIKLSKDTSLANIMQYEYTYLPGQPIWFDLSDVNGNPWDGDWEITSAGNCKPKQSAYRYATDDAYGMQDCPADSDITVTLCSGESQDDGAASSASTSAAAVTTVQTSAAASTPSAIGASTNTPVVQTTASAVQSSFYHGLIAEQSAASTPASTPTTLATSTVVVASEAEAVTTEGPAAVVVTEIVTEIATEVVTATAYDKRAEHVHRHAHHPHMRS